MTGEEIPAHYERSDICVVPAAGIIVEAMCAIVLAHGGAREVRRRFDRRDAAQLARVRSDDGAAVASRVT